ncbi:MAG: hypothetical protein ABIH70_00630 [Chloroflexota bacterium]
MLKNIFRGLGICLLVVLLVAVVASPVLAFDGRTGDTVTVPSGEVVEGDLYVAGGNIIIDGTVNGDVFGAGQSLAINGAVNGGVTFAGQTITLNGDISHGARLAGTSITLNGNVGRDLLVAGSEVTTNSQSTIVGDLILATNMAFIRGRVNGNIKGGAGSVILADGVGGNIQLAVDRLTVTSTASIQGNLIYTSENEASIQSGASIFGTTTHKLPEARKSAKAFYPVLAGIAVVWQILGFLMILVVGIVIILIASRRVTLMADSIQAKPWQSLGWGTVILIVTPIAAVIVMITVIGLPVGLISLALYGIALSLSQVPVASLIGRLIIKQNRKIESKALMIGALALGLLILFLLGLIPYIGWIVGLLTIVFGLGSLVTAMRRTEGTSPG